MVTCTSHSPVETEAVGKAWGQAATPGLVIGLMGELGAGKTQLVRGLACGLGATERVHSPTFVLVNEYRSGRLPMFHLDLYRLQTPADIVAAGLEEYLCGVSGITVVEWIERWWPLPWRAEDVRWTGSPTRNMYRMVRMETVSETQRRISYEDFGA